MDVVVKSGTYPNIAYEPYGWVGKRKPWYKRGGVSEMDAETSEKMRTVQPVEVIGYVRDGGGYFGTVLNEVTPSNAHTRADDAPISENPVPSLKESTEDTHVLTDNREELLDHIWCEITTTLRNNGRLYDPNFWYANIVSWLDRQAAITRRENAEKVAELQKERDWWRDECDEMYQRAVDELADDIVYPLPSGEPDPASMVWAHLMGERAYMDDLRRENDELRSVVKQQADSFAKMERELAEARKERTCRIGDYTSEDEGTHKAYQYDEFWMPAGKCSACGEYVVVSNYCFKCGARIVDVPPNVLEPF